MTVLYIVYTRNVIIIIIIIVHEYVRGVWGLEYNIVKQVCTMTMYVLDNV